MKSLAIVAFTRKGCDLARTLALRLAEVPAYAQASFTVSGPSRYADDLAIEPYADLQSWTARHFTSDDALVFVGACGIAVRAIAPYVRDKFTDPAVVSVDEAGRFAVPLLSGHVGGANELARAVARATSGQAAVSTATDVNGVFAVDEWAARHDLIIVERQIAKEVSAALLEGQPVGYALECKCDFGDDLPFGMVDASASEDVALGFVVSFDERTLAFARTLHLVPRIVTVGIGCRKGTDLAVLRKEVLNVLAQARISPKAIAAIASIDVKRDEPAILELAQALGCDTRFYSADELASVQGNFASSDFVEATVGIDNVCERAACAQGAALIVGKHARNGVTVACAAEWDSSPDAPRSNGPGMRETCQ